MWLSRRGPFSPGWRTPSSGCWNSLSFIFHFHPLESNLFNVKLNAVFKKATCGLEEAFETEKGMIEGHGEGDMILTRRISP